MDFFSNKSILTNMLCYLFGWTRSIDKGCCVEVIYLDFSKAFAETTTNWQNRTCRDSRKATVLDPLLPKGSKILPERTATR